MVETAQLENMFYQYPVYHTAVNVMKIIIAKFSISYVLTIIFF